MEKLEYYILFPNYTEGMKLESILKENKIKYIISPTPRQLSSCCGISIKYEKENEGKIKSLVKENKINTEGFFPLKRVIKNFYV
ncbi:DUF3343 domain-containing protein [Hathewaya histolytica]|uniref:Protein of uncharacterized function (DUF3343) n=1 Tax=Hathewaya histolytica TaxID=1498 RepID=A0A4U9R0L5_HATHI|nr:DUF3343 domain-containing protein [Hathewaya histolytica]VTQ83433.1 Protein of uncharacterised function (DUF3343) [Hathewaya histolytica]